MISVELKGGVVKEFEKNIKEFKRYIETLNSSWVNDTEKSVKTKYFNY